MSETETKSKPEAPKRGRPEGLAETPCYAVRCRWCAGDGWDSIYKAANGRKCRECGGTGRRNVQAQPTAPQAGVTNNEEADRGSSGEASCSAAAYCGSISITDKDENTATLFVSDGNSSVLKDIPKENLKYIIYMADQASKVESQRASCYDEWSSHTSVGIALGHASKL